jgi:hypothetical protein
MVLVLYLGEGFLLLGRGVKIGVSALLTGEFDLD